jgi:hypothetical protein
MPVVIVLGAAPAGLTESRVVAPAPAVCPSTLQVLPYGREALARVGGGKAVVKGKGKKVNEFPEERINIPVGVTPATLKNFNLYAVRPPKL